MWINRLPQTFRSLITNPQEESKFFSSAKASSSSSVILESKYDVFLSFRGEDTRHNFTAHLYAALCQKKIATFIDDDRLKTGDEISPVLLRAIEDSKVSVIIFSKDYDSSTWCLDELSKIVECRISKGQKVVPVFYHIDPSDIRKQTGSYGNAFVKHHKRFKKTPERVQKWRAALTEAANLSGHHLTGNRSESKLVEEIVRDILKKLIDMSPINNNCEGLVGLDRRIEQINLLLEKSKIVGIWGMGGIGKTTIVEVLFGRISRDFESCCFINVGKQLEKHQDQLVKLQQGIISRILEEENIILEVSNAIPQSIKDMLHRTKFLVVLDDVNNFKCLKLLMRGLEQLHEESRIIVTTRDKQVLSYCSVNHIYEVEGLNFHEATLLFCKCAFKKNHAPENLKQLSSKIIAYAKGNPLALEVLGSSLSDKSKEAWESVMLNLNVIAAHEILDALKISYDGLTDTEKSMFLDIACFLNWEIEDVAKEILKATYEPMEYCFEVLINKALIKTSYSMLQMHDLLQEMGRGIVRKECENNPGKRSRLWIEDDVRHVLQNNKGTDAIKGIFLDMSTLRTEIHLSSKAFVNMVNLRVLKLYRSRSDANTSNFCLPSVLEDLPNKLRYLHWEEYPWDELPSKFSAEKLVELKLPYSKIQKLWEGAKHVVNLKSIDFSKSEHLIEFPNPQNAPMLETIKFGGCKWLLKVPPYIACFTNLSFLNMGGCENLRRFHRNIHFQSPITLDFTGCINLTEFPKVLGKVKHLYLGGTAIEEIPASIELLTELVTLRMYCCKKLKNISPNIYKLSLSELYFYECSKLESLPEVMEEMKRLQLRNLYGTAIQELPSSTENQVGLTDLELYKCGKLEAIPTSSSKLLYLDSLSETRTAVSQLPSSLCLSLVRLDLSDNNFESLPTSIKQLSKLRALYLSNCNVLLSIPELPLRIEYLYVYNCKQLRSLPQLPSEIEQCDEEVSPMYMKDFDFVNCLNMIEIFSRQRIERMATALGLFYKKELDEIPRFKYFLPGSKIPKWFVHQGYGSITIELPQQYCGNRRFIGFALSAVFPPGTNVSKPDRYQVDCKCGIANKTVYFCVSYPDSLESDHIGINFIPATDIMLLGDQSTTVTFNFRMESDNPFCEELVYLHFGVCPIYEELNMAQSSSCFERFAPTDEDIKEIMPADSSNDSEVCKVKHCGVDPLDAERNVSQPGASNDLFSVSSEDLDKTITKDSSKRKFHEIIKSGNEIGKSYEEEVEPDPKRICKNQVNPSLTEKFVSSIKSGLSTLFRRT